MNRLVKILFSRVVIVVALLLLQVGVLFATIWYLAQYYVYVYVAFTLFSLCVVVRIINKNMNPGYKLAWSVAIMLFPIFGGLLYLLFGGSRSSRDFKMSMETEYLHTIPYYRLQPQLQATIAAEDADVAQQCYYLENTCGFPLYRNTETEYLSPGEEMYRRLMEELEKAEHYIFMEYFIIAEGKMWDSVRELLIRKAKAGVDVRLVYDDAGSISTLPYQYYKQLEKYGIKSAAFQPFTPKMTFRLNNRDHRKITVIDGHTGFCGGANLADEYINEKERFGHWKDAAVMLKGEAVWSLTLMFLYVWHIAHSGTTEDYSEFRPQVHVGGDFGGAGYVQPYADSPRHEETIGAMVYMNIINRASDYVYIETPYLILDNELQTALCLAAKSGIDVRIITPGIPDKKYVFTVTRSYYPQLLEAGVRIFEYTPGFIHSKVFVSDDKVATVGTVNLDYRSLYLHFECGVWMYKTPAVDAAKADFLQTQDLSKEITLEDCRKVRWYTRLVRSVLRALAPLL